MLFSPHLLNELSTQLMCLFSSEIPSVGDNWGRIQQINDAHCWWYIDQISTSNADQRRQGLANCKRSTSSEGIWRFVCSIFVFLLLPFDFKVSLGVIVSRRFCSRTRELQPVSNKIVVLKQLFSRQCLFWSAFQFWNKEVCVYFFVCLYVISVWLLLV